MFAAVPATVWSGVGAVIGSFIGAIITGYFLLRRFDKERNAKRSDDKRDLYTAALDAVTEYEELPYRIRRRSDVTPMTREELTSRASDIQVELDKYVARLTFESEPVGHAYEELVRAARGESGSNMKEAWKTPRIENDSDMSLGVAYPRQSSTSAKRHCMSVMQADLAQKATS